MVTFEKTKEDDRYITYIYFPEDDKKKKPGLIVVDKQQETIEITKVAEIDIERDIPPEELNELVNAINEMKREAGETDFLELASEFEHSVWYGDHAVYRICKYIKSGKIPDKGMEDWY